MRSGCVVLLKWTLLAVFMLFLFLLHGCAEELWIQPESSSNEMVDTKSADNSMKLAWISWKGIPFTGENWHGDDQNSSAGSLDLTNDLALQSVNDAIGAVGLLDTNDKIESYTYQLYSILIGDEYLDTTMRPYYAEHYINGIWVISFTDRTFTLRSEWIDSKAPESDAGLWYTYVLLDEVNGKILTILKSAYSKLEGITTAGEDIIGMLPEGQLYAVTWRSAWYEEYAESLYTPFVAGGTTDSAFDDLVMQAKAIEAACGEPLNSVECIVTYANTILPGLEECGYFDFIKAMSKSENVIPATATHFADGTWMISYCAKQNLDYECCVTVNAEDGAILRIQ